MSVIEERLTRFQPTQPKFPNFRLQFAQNHNLFKF